MRSFCWIFAHFLKWFFYLFVFYLYQSIFLLYSYKQLISCGCFARNWLRWVSWWWTFYVNCHKTKTNSKWEEVGLCIAKKRLWRERILCHFYSFERNLSKNQLKLIRSTEECHERGPVWQMASVTWTTDCNGSFEYWPSAHFEVIL